MRRPGRARRPDGQGSPVFPGPAFLGRGVVVRRGAPAPLDAPRVREVEELDAAWRARRSVVVELTMEPEELKERETWTGEVYRLTPAFEFRRERLHFLTWANHYDGTRGGEPLWWHGRLAARLGYTGLTDGGPRGGLDVPVLHRESIEMGSTRLTVPAEFSGLDLAPDQRAAVLHPGGAARILAPAGSGKTRVLTERLRHLLVDRGYERERVTALAYNRRAAEEMKARTTAFQPRVQTLHALGYGLLGRPRLLEEREVRDLLRPMLDLPSVLGQDPLAPYLEALAEVRLGLRLPEQVEARRGDVEGFASLFPRYRERLQRMGVLDHDEQIYAALELLLADPEVRREAQRRCTHLLVDEFQDLTPAYLLLVRLLAGPAGQVYGVGDDDQVIYGYAGADPGFLIGYRRYFPGAAEYALEVNYRCPSGVVEAAGRLLGHNRRRVAKTIRSGSGVEGRPEVARVPPSEWAPRAVRLVQGWLQEDADPSRVAVLARTQAALLPVQVYLQAAGVPFHSLVDGSALQRTGMRAALAWLRLAGGAWRPEELAEALRRPNRKLRRELLDQASRCRSANDLLTLAMSQEPWPAQQLEEFARDVRLLGRRLAQGVPAALEALREQVGLGTALEELDREAADSHLDDLLALEQAARLHPSPGSFEEWLRGALAARGRQGVRLSTVHRVKGMEWDRVLVYGAQAGLWPHRLAGDREEERRVFHVALTRGRRHVAVLADLERPSPFLDELEEPRKPLVPDQELSLESWAAAWRVPVPVLEKALLHLGEPERGVLQARLAGQSEAEIAARLGKSPGAVRTWVQLAERTLRARCPRGS